MSISSINNQPLSNVGPYNLSSNSLLCNLLVAAEADIVDISANTITAGVITASEFVGPSVAGATGSTGATGATGPQGVTGAQGASGAGFLPSCESIQLVQSPNNSVPVGTMFTMATQVFNNSSGAIV